MRVGPRPRPSSPVIPNTTPRPAAELAVRGSTNQISSNAPPRLSRLVIGPMFRKTDTVAVSALNNRVMESRV